MLMTYVYIDYFYVQIKIYVNCSQMVKSIPIICKLNYYYYTKNQYYYINMINISP